jgi:hypothetical protein
LPFLFAVHISSASTRNQNGVHRLRFQTESACFYFAEPICLQYNLRLISTADFSIAFLCNEEVVAAFTSLHVQAAAARAFILGSGRAGF